MKYKKNGDHHIKKLIMILVIAKIIITNISLTLDIQIPPSFYILLIEELQIITHTNCRCFKLKK